jgi:hypothetical protein
MRIHNPARLNADYLIGHASLYVLVGEYGNAAPSATYSTDFEAVLTGIKKRLKRRVSFDILKINNQNYVTKVGVRVPNSNYYTCMIGELEVNRDITTFGIKTFRLHKERYNYNWGNEWAGASITTKIPRAVSIVSRIETLYDHELIKLAVADVANDAQIEMHRPKAKYDAVDKQFQDRVTGFRDGAAKATVQLLKELIEASKVGRLVNLDPNNSVLKQYEEYCNERETLGETVEHLGERVAIQVLKLFNRDEINMAYYPMDTGNSRYICLPSISHLPETIQTLMHTVNIMGEHDEWNDNKKCSVGMSQNPKTKILAEEHYVLFVPKDEADDLVARITGETTHVPE